MSGNRFQRKLTLFFTALVAIVQLGAFAAVVAATNHNVRQQARNELAVGSNVVQQEMQSRSRRLLQSVQVLADDFGFKRAVATADQATMRSALGNHAARIDADLALLLNTDGAVQATTTEAVTRGGDFPIPELLSRARQQGEAVSVGLIGGEAYQLVLVPVRAPVTIGWICLGFVIDQELAMELDRVTVGEVGFEIHSDGGHRLLASSGERQTNPMPFGPQAERVSMAATPEGEYLVASRQLANRDDHSINAVLTIPMAQALAPYQPLRQQLLALAGAGLVVSLIGSLWLARAVSRPVRHLLEGANRVAAGDYDRSVDVRQSDELGGLADAFNGMQAAIRSRENRIYHQAYHDELTGLPNRALVRQRLQERIERAQRDGGSIVTAVLDIDRFKEINDSLGHEVGDSVLREVARRLSGIVRDGDTVGRLGGDEFAIVAEGAGTIDSEELVDRIRAAALEPYETGPTALRIDFSVGVSRFPEHGTSIESLLRRADIAMYQAKDRGQLAVVYESGWDELHQERLTLLADLRASLQGEHFLLEYQPQVCLRDGTITHVEALLRWEHPEHGRIPPDRFVPLAEQAGYIKQLSRWVIEQAIRQAAAWRQEGIELHIAINISALDLLDDSLPDFLVATLDRFGVTADYLGLEVTESAIMRDAPHAIRVLQRLKDLGIRLSIDDFGKGHSSLAQLQRLPVDELKIDKSFIMTLDPGDADDRNAAIVRSTIELGHNMHLKVLAEGVETPRCHRWLSQYNCDLAQGFLFSKPLPADRLAQWIRDWSPDSTAITTQRDEDE